MARANRLLIVDDDPGHLTTLKTISRSWGYEVLPRQPMVVRLWRRCVPYRWIWYSWMSA